jgi:hypothetical protein
VLVAQWTRCRSCKGGGVRGAMTKEADRGAVRVCIRTRWAFTPVAALHAREAVEARGWQTATAGPSHRLRARRAIKRAAERGCVGGSRPARASGVSAVGGTSSTGRSACCNARASSSVASSSFFARSAYLHSDHRDTVVRGYDRRALRADARGGVGARGTYTQPKWRARALSGSVLSPPRGESHALSRLWIISTHTSK